MTATPETDRARFYRFADRPSPGACWLWHGSITRHGYGRFSLGLKWEKAHRAAWRIFRGAIPPGLFVLHRCDEKRCVNPRHLALGTHADNVRDALARGRYRRGFRATHCPSGHDLEAHGVPNSRGYRECGLCRVGRKAAKRREAGVVPRRFRGPRRWPAVMFAASVDEQPADRFPDEAIAGLAESAAADGDDA